MKVYGDAEEEVSVSDLLKRINGRVDATNFHNIASVRALLIEAGQVEQALADAEADVGSELVREASNLADWAAELFCWLYFTEAPKGKGAISDFPNAPGDWRTLNASPVSERSPNLTVKIPEGFAFYALYPEQYCTSAVRWAAEHPGGEKSAVVIGLRSIGTTLAAVVNAALRLHGLETTRIAVRASGHPFDRHIELPRLPRRDWALVVDEGPGMSGSSMAAVAEALRSQGFDSDRMVFFPAHENGPGDAASETVRSWWNDVQVVTTELARTRWKDCTVEEQLIEASADLVPSVAADRDVRAPVLEDCSGGLWRRFAFRSEDEWPAVGAQFERMKFLYRTESGSILWKFTGLVPRLADEELARMSKRSAYTSSPAPLRVCNGFVAMPWVEGERLTSDDADAMLQTLAGYIANSAQAPLARDAVLAATRRVAEMTASNLREAFRSAWPRSLERFVQRFRPTFHMPCYGDGRMAPHEWVRTDEAQVFKTDAVGHDCDHTLVGRQPVQWDVAGVIVEWGLNEAQVEQFLCDCREVGVPVSEEELLFYRLAYAAFRLGFCTLNQGLTGDENESARLGAAAQRYGMLLRRLIRTSFSNSVTMLSDPGLISTRDMMSSEMPRK